MKKLYDLAVKTGSYEKAGETKNRYENIGAIFENEDGGRMLFIKRSFNPAGVPFRENSDSILVSMFKPKTDSEQTASENVSEKIENKFSDAEVPF
jgi:hypothetical protein